MGALKPRGSKGLFRRSVSYSRDPSVGRVPVRGCAIAIAIVGPAGSLGIFRLFARFASSSARQALRDPRSISLVGEW